MSVIIWIHLDQIVRQDNSSSSVIINVKTWLLKCAQMWRYCILWGRKHQIKVKNLSDHIPNKLSLNEIWTNIRPLSVNDPVSVPFTPPGGNLLHTHHKSTFRVNPKLCVSPASGEAEALCGKCADVVWLCEFLCGDEQVGSLPSLHECVWMGECWHVA